MTYFDNNGISSTHAAYIKNLAKEVASIEDNKISEMKFYEVKAKLINSENENVILSPFGSIDGLKESVNIISKIYGLSAWLGEAIKEKELLIRNARDVNITNFAKKFNIELPIAPNMPLTTNKDLVLKTKDTKFISNYYKYEAIASHLGKMVHESGLLSKIRRTCYRIKTNPVEMIGEGRDLIIKNKKLSIDVCDIDAVYFDIQSKYREAQSNLNKMKSDIEKEVSDYNLKELDEYKTSLDEYNRKVKSIEVEAKKHSVKEVAKVSSLKILIPDIFKDVYNYLNTINL